MAILKLARMGNPALRERANEVEDPTAPAIHALVRDMAETLSDARGAGLAAPQVHVPLRVVIFHMPKPGAVNDVEEGERYPDGALPDGNLEVLVNPVITPVGEEMVFGWEGCLSVPGMRGIVPRHRAIRYTALGLDGKPIERVAEDFHARVVQHECDHLDGVLYPQRVTDMRLFGFDEEFDRHPLRLEMEDEDQDAGGAEADAS